MKKLILILTLALTSCLPILQDNSTTTVPEKSAFLLKKYDRITAIYVEDQTLQLDYPYYFINGAFETSPERDDIIDALNEFEIEFSLNNFIHTESVQINFVSSPIIEEIQVDRNGEYINMVWDQ